MKKLLMILIPALIAGLAPLGASADVPGRHPGYLHALTDLRAARWLLSHQAGDGRVFRDEEIGVREIDAAIGELKRAAIDDGKNLEDHPGVDAAQRGSRLERAVETLRKARADISGEEENPEARRWRRAAFEHIDIALHAAERAHAEWLRDVRR